MNPPTPPVEPPIGDACDRGAIGRRTFLALGGGAVLTAVGIGWLAADGDSSGPAASDPTPPPDSDRATQAVGERYLVVAPEEAEAEALRSLLPGELGTAPQVASAEVVDRAVRRDFARGDVVEVDGWVLSRVECRLAALTVVS